jgi:hypothetical protein
MMHLVGHFICIFVENDARNHEHKKFTTIHCVIPKKSAGFNYLVTEA